MGCCHRSPVKVHNEYQQGDPTLSGRPYATPRKPQQCNHGLNSRLHYNTLLQKIFNNCVLITASTLPKKHKTLLICPHIVLRLFRMSSLSSQISLIKLPRCGHCRTNSIALPPILNIGLRQQLYLLSFLGQLYTHFDFLALNNILNPLANTSHKDNNLCVAL